MNLLQKFLIIVLLTISTQRLAAQTWEGDIAQYFDSVRRGARVAMPAHAEKGALAIDLLHVTRRYLNDSVAAVRVKSRELLFATASSSVVARSKAIDYLLEATQPADPLTSGMVLNMIKAFSNHDFSENARTSVRRLVNAEGPHLGEWIRIAAFLQLTDLVPVIRPYAQPGNRESLRWSALVSLARLEDKSAGAEVLKLVTRLPLNDDLIYNIFPDVLFTRNRSAIDYMIEVLHDDDRHCFSADAEREMQIPCGYRIMEQLAPVIDGLPVRLDGAGDIQTTDYAKTLANVRHWFHSHRDYGIKKERY